MATRKSATKIDPIQVCVLALKKVRSKADYNRIVAANTEADVKAAWATLPSEEQQHILNICGATPQPDLQAIASELTSCGTLIQLQAVKAEHGEEVVRQAWKMISVDERRRLKALCDNSHKPSEEPQPVTEEPAAYRVDQQQPTQHLGQTHLNEQQNVILTSAL